MAILQFLVNHFVKFTWLDGYKMYGVGASLMFSGLGTLAHAVAVGGFQLDDSTVNAFKLIAAGVGVIGAAGKADKLIAAQAVTTAATVQASLRVASAVRSVP